MDNFDWKTFFGVLGFSGEDAEWLHGFFASCGKAAAIAGGGFGATASYESMKRNPGADQRVSLITGVVGALIAGGAVYVTCRLVRSKAIETVSPYMSGANDPGVVALRLTNEQRKTIIDEARTLLRFRQTEAKSPELYAAGRRSRAAGTTV